MALALTPPHNVVFIHTHKTGGTWVRHALEADGDSRARGVPAPARDLRPQRRRLQRQQLRRAAGVAERVGLVR